MHRKVTQFLSITAISSALALTPLAASAQAAAASPPTEATTSYSQTDLQKFVAAAEKVSVLTQEYAPKVQATASAEERDAVVKEADEKMMGAVQDEGLTVEKFLAINQAAQADPKLQERLVELSE